MDAQYFVYTRGNDIANDYKLMFSPANDFCPDDVRKYFLQQVRGLINIEMYQGNLNSPRWLFSRFSGFILWGVGIMNSQLSDINNSDYANRPVRGFFGIIGKSESLTSLPFDLLYFKKFYQQYIVDLWNTSKDNFKQKGVCVDISFDGYDLILPKQQANRILNFDEQKTIIWEDTFTPKEMFSDALCGNGNLTCVYGLEEKSHAYNHDYRYYNVIILGVKETEEKEYVKKKKEYTATTQTSTLDAVSSVPKKDLRPKIVILIGIVVMILIIIAMCSKGIQTSKHTTSGEKMQNQNPNHSSQFPDSSLIK